MAPTGGHFHPQPVGNGDDWPDSHRNPLSEGVKLLAKAGTAHKPRCQLPYYLHHPFKNLYKRVYDGT